MRRYETGDKPHYTASLQLDVTISGETMATIDHLTTTSAQTLHDRTHLRPLDSVLIALEETSCTWCTGLLRLLKDHLEADIPTAGSEVLN